MDRDVEHVHVFVRGYLPELVVNERSRVVPEYKAWLLSTLTQQLLQPPKPARAHSELNNAT